MDDKNLEAALQAYKNKSDETWLMNVMNLNMACIEALQKEKAKSKLISLSVFKKMVIAGGLLYILFLGFLVYLDHFRHFYFSFSMSMILLITMIAIITMIKHIVMIRQINYSTSITDTQKKLSALQYSTINIFRISWLQLPFWSTWFWTSQWIYHSGINFWLIAVPVTLILALIAIWLYRKISFKNKDKKWFKFLMNSSEWTSVAKAKEFIDEIDEFKKDVS
jgi:hypothetical protein